MFVHRNRAGGNATGRAFGELVREVGDGDVADLSDRYTWTGAGPALWDRSDHDEGFGSPIARISYALPGPENPSGIE